MSSDFVLSEDVEKLVKNIISKYKWDPLSDVKYQPGSEVGDGYTTKTIAIDITSGKELFKLFVKCALDNIKSTDTLPVHKLYINEIYFYDTIYPAYREFLNARGVEDGFRHVPKCYGTSEAGYIVALENLRFKGFNLFDRNQLMNDSHTTMVLRTFAKFHAVSFAFKDQERKKYDQLLLNITDFMTLDVEELPFQTLVKQTLVDLIAKLDPVEDRDILDKCDVTDLVRSIRSAGTSFNKYSILTQGDCWCNNMLFLYEKKNTENPIDIMLIDWQIMRPASPVLDISYFFYSIASEESLSKLESYLKVYHEELAKQIRQLGSDPDVLYPFEILEKQWKEHCKFGFVISFMLIKIMLSAKDEAISFENMDMENLENIGNLYPKFAKEDEYITRMKMLTRFMIRNDYI